MEHKIYISSTDNIQLCALLKESSKDQAVLLCHGIRGDKHECGSFDALAAALQEKKFSTLRIDFRGHGASTGNDYDVNISGEIEDVESALSYLRKKGYQEIIVLGASFGASIVSLLDCDQFPEIKALILWYGALDNYDVLRTDSFLSGRNRMIAEQDGFFLSYNNAGEPFRFGLSLFEDINRYRPKDQLLKNTLPKLFVHGLEDTLVPYGISVELAKLCPSATLELIAEGTHSFDTGGKSLQDAVEITAAFAAQIFDKK